MSRRFWTPPLTTWSRWRCPECRVSCQGRRAARSKDDSACNLIQDTQRIGSDMLEIDNPRDTVIAAVLVLKYKKRDKSTFCEILYFDCCTIFTEMILGEAKNPKMWQIYLLFHCIAEYYLCTLFLHYIIWDDFHISKRFLFFVVISVSGHNSLFYSCHQLVTIADKAAVSSGVVQSAVRNYINLNIGEQLGRSILILILKINNFGQCFGSGSALFWLTCIRIRIGKSDLDADPGSKMNK